MTVAGIRRQQHVGGLLDGMKLVRGVCRAEGMAAVQSGCSIDRNSLVHPHDKTLLYWKCMVSDEVTR